MQTTSDAYRAAIRESHPLSVAIDVLEQGQVIHTLETVREGSVTLDAKAASRGRMDVSLVDDGTLGLVPTQPGSLLAPYGHELQIRRGPILPSGTAETLSLGIFRIDTTRVDDTADGLQIALSGLDRSAVIIDARFEEPYEIAAGTPVEEAIRTTLQIAMPAIVTDFPVTAFTTPALRAAEGDDRWKFCQDIATACGLVLFFGAAGHAQLESLTTTDSVATFAEGPTGVLIHASRSWERTGAFNRVIATGENTGEAAPARGVATDENPESPTYYYGPFGRVPRFYQSQFITTDAQAAAAAQAMLARELGTTQTVEFGAIVDTSLEPGDTVQVTRLRAGINEQHILDQLVFPLGPEGEMSAQTRATQVT